MNKPERVRADIAWEPGEEGKVDARVDSQAILSLIRATNLDEHQHGVEVAALRELLERDWEVTITHTYREGNSAVDYLANLGHQFPLGVHPIPSHDYGVFISMALGENRSCGLRRDDTVVCWGENGFWLLESLEGSHFITIEAKRSVFCGIVRDDFSLLCWGGNINPQSPSSSMIFQRVLPSPCRIDSQCRCGALTGSGNPSLCRPGYIICQNCPINSDPLPLPPPSQSSSPPPSSTESSRSARYTNGNEWRRRRRGAADVGGGVWVWW
ncbi:Serine/threonine-protein kinase-like protein CCR4 [Linum perenne]